MSSSSLLLHPSIPESLTLGVGDKAKTYLLRTPSVMDRARYRRAIAEAGARRSGPVGLLDALSRSVASLMAESDDDVRGAVLAKIAAYREKLAAYAEAARDGEYDTDDGKARAATDLLDLVKSGEALRAIEDAARGGDPKYAAQCADDEAYFGFAGVVGARMFLVGWTGFDGDVARGPEGATEATLAKIPEGHFPAIGLKLETMLNLSETQRKNSVSPPAGLSGGNSSTTSKDTPQTIQ
jgi:hypothetical protein